MRWLSIVQSIRIRKLDVAAGCCWLLLVADGDTEDTVQLRLILFLVTVISLVIWCFCGGRMAVAVWVVVECKIRLCMIQNNSSLRQRLFEEVEIHWKSG
jgi:hypothetical protein